MGQDSECPFPRPLESILITDPPVPEEDFPKVNFNSNATMGDLNEHVDVQGDHREIIREIGAASAVLLKNVNNTLPLSANAYRKWGIFGSDAGYPLLGPDGCPYKACLQQGTLTTGWGSGSAELPSVSFSPPIFPTFLRFFIPGVLSLNLL